MHICKYSGYLSFILRSSFVGSSTVSLVSPAATPCIPYTHSLLCRIFAAQLPAMLQAVHHFAIICSNYEASKKFYTDVLGFNAGYESVFPSAHYFFVIYT